MNFKELSANEIYLNSNNIEENLSKIEDSELEKMIETVFSEDLMGNCRSENEILNDYFKPNTLSRIAKLDYSKIVDEIGFECGICNWWYPVGEGDGEFCDSCLEEQNYEQMEEEEFLRG